MINRGRTAVEVSIAEVTAEKSLEEVFIELMSTDIQTHAGKNEENTHA